MVQYDLDRAKSALDKSILFDRVASLWRYRELLPLQSETNLVSLGEGYTPLLDTKTALSVSDVEKLIDFVPELLRHVSGDSRVGDFFEGDFPAGKLSEKL
jgi:threonine synthase